MTMVQRCRLLLVALQLVSSTTSSTNSLRRRLLSQEPFWTYEPLTTVLDEALLDLDQQTMAVELEANRFLNAQAIYTKGGYSQSYARLTLSEPLSRDIPQGKDVMGKNQKGEWTIGKVKTVAKANATVIQVDYHVSPVQKDLINGCYVGAIPIPSLEGCFADKGSIEVDNEGSYSYTYDPSKDNRNQRSLQKLGATGKEIMFACQDNRNTNKDCRNPTFVKFFSYYGTYDYGNEWIMAAFQNTHTDFGHGNANFSITTDQGRKEAIDGATIRMNLWMSVVAHMERAVEMCEYSNGNNSDEHIHSWDQAVAYYMGSVAKQAKGDNFEGYSLWTLAESRGMLSNTRNHVQLENGYIQEVSLVNQDIFKNFVLGQRDLMEGLCDATKTIAKRIQQSMVVPLVQGTLAAAYAMDLGPQRDMVGHDLQAEGAVFAASILPLVHSCDSADAELLHRNMGMETGQDANFHSVKDILERNYDCLQITCEEVGGVADVANENNIYMTGGEPCGHQQPAGEESQSTNTANGVMTTFTFDDNTDTKKSSTGLGGNPGAAIGLTIAIVVCLLLIAFLVSRKRKENEKEFDGMGEPKEVKVPNLPYES